MWVLASGGSDNHTGVMNKTAAFMPADLNRLERESSMVQATVESLSADELAAPSRLEGWTRAQVVAHLAGTAKGFQNLINWAATGTETPMYPSTEAREADLEELASKPPAELKAAYRQAFTGMLADAQKLRGKLATTDINLLGMPISPYLIPALQMQEIILHHLDLDTLWELHEADIDALEDSLELAAGFVADRPDYPGVTLITDEGETFTIGDGATTLKGGRDALLGWIARGMTEGVRAEGEIPAPGKYI